MPVTLEDLNANEEVIEHLGMICDFEPSRGGDAEPPICTVDGAADLTVIGRDGAGGQFAVSPAAPRVFYFSSEGEAGALAADVDAFIKLIVHCPYWPDLLKYSARGRLDEMRRAAPALEAYWSLAEDDVASREFLRLALRLGEPGDVVGALHAAVSSAADIRDPYGMRCDSLFGRFTVDDNPMLKFGERPEV